MPFAAMAPCLLRLGQLLGLPSSSTSLGLEEYWLLCDPVGVGLLDVPSGLKSGGALWREPLWGVGPRGAARGAQGSTLSPCYAATWIV